MSSNECAGLQTQYDVFSLDKAETLALLHGCGFSYEELKKPRVAVFNTLNPMNPGHIHQGAIAKAVAEGVREAGGLPVEFNGTNLCDSMLENQKYTLPSRDLLVNDIDLMEKLDAFTRYLGNCGLFHFFDAIQKWVLVFTGIIVFVLTIATVFLRYVLTMNVLGLDEIILLVIFWQYFIGAAQGSREDSQIKADMVSTVVKNKTVVAWCHLLARIIECGVIGVCIKWSIDYILKDMSVMPYTVVLVGFALMILYHIYWLLTELVNVGTLKKEEQQA